MTHSLDYAIYDADNHYYEPDDCFSRHIETKYKDRTVWIDRKTEGPGRMYIGDERCHFFSVGTGDNIGPPGIMKEFLRGMSEEGGNPSLNPINALEVPEFVDRGARLAKMDEQRVEATLMLPTTGVGIEPQLRQPQHREALYPSLRAFNRWLEEDWGYGGDGRIYGAPLLSLVDVAEAIAELDRVVALGARFVVVTAGPIDGKSSVTMTSETLTVRLRPSDPPGWYRAKSSGSKPFS